MQRDAADPPFTLNLNFAFISRRADPTERLSLLVLLTRSSKAV
jgi:hypothetical protein